MIEIVVDMILIIWLLGFIDFNSLRRRTNNRSFTSTWGAFRIREFGRFYSETQREESDLEQKSVEEIKKNLIG